ncbi:hypothetical protein BIU97_11130 [Curtobacterium sp. MCBA15_009]|nr:hypothetical protein BIU92_09675 [Curtobacterium sp. MCBA15_003]OII10646.1 hypothetical protein BIU97_11130 [Curtobacterium sp. MCBA15_009]
MTTPGTSTGTTDVPRASTPAVVTTSVVRTTGATVGGTTTLAAGDATTAAEGAGQRQLAYTGASSPVLPLGFALLLLLAGAGTLVLRRRH